MNRNLTVVVENHNVKKYTVVVEHGDSSVTPPQPETRILTFNVTGLPIDSILSLNGVALSGRTKTYNLNEVLPQLVLSSPGFTIAPIVASGTIMDANKTLNFTATAVVGRVFTVGNGNGDLTIDAANNTWAPLQPGDIFKIVGGTYNNINMKNLSAADGSVINVTNDTALVTTKVFSFSGSLKTNLNLDFLNKVAGNTYGVVINAGDDLGEKFRINEDGTGDMSIRVKGILTKNTKDRGWRNMSKDIPYNNGADKVSIKLLDVQNCKWMNDAGNTNYSDGIYLGGSFNQGAEDVGYVEKFIFKNIVVENCNCDFVANNIGDYEISDVQLLGVYPTAVHHARIIDMWGSGIVERIKGDLHYGNMFRVVPMVRNSKSNKTTIIRNIKGSRSRKYSCLEVNQFEALQKITNGGIMTLGSVKVLGSSAYNMGTSNTYTSTVLDIFSGDANGSGITIKNCASINPFIEGGGAVTVVNGPVQAATNNYAAANNTNAKIDTTTLKPGAGSVLKGAGVADADLLTDYDLQVRINPPTIGALEGL